MNFLRTFFICSLVTLIFVICAPFVVIGFAAGMAWNAIVEGMDKVNDFTDWLYRLMAETSERLVKDDSTRTYERMSPVQFVDSESEANGMTPGPAPHYDFPEYSHSQTIELHYTAASALVELQQWRTNFEDIANTPDEAMLAVSQMAQRLADARDDAKTLRAVMSWMRNSLLTDSQLDVVPPGWHASLRFTEFRDEPAKV